VWGGETLLTQDLRAAIAAARARHPNAVLAVVGESMGGATAMATFAQADPPAVDRVVLSAPAVRGWSSMPRLYAFTLWLGAHTVPARRLTPPDAVVERITPSDNIEMLRAIGMDPLMVFDTRIDAVYGLVSLMQSASESAEAAPENTLVLYGAHDDIIPPEAMDGAAARLPETVRTAYYADGYHMLLRDLQRERVFDDVLAFLRDPDAPLPSGAPPIQSPTLR
jgi:alpha-beta hydrolase superfamily lysophospholipase